MAASGWLRDGVLPATALLVLGIVNAPVYDWIGLSLQHVVMNDAQLLRNDIGITGPTPVLFGGNAFDVRDQLRFLHAHGLNLFSAENAPPPAVLARLQSADPETLPPCAGNIDDTYAIDGNAFLIRGWLADRAGTHTLPWFAVRDAAGHVLGTARGLGERPDVQAALGLKAPAFGFETGFRLRAPGGFSGAPAMLRVFGIDPGAPVPLCVVKQPALVGPVAVPPLAAMQPIASASTAAPQADGFVPGRGDEAPLAAQAVWRAPGTLPGAPARLRFVLPAASDPALSLAVPFEFAGGSASLRLSVRFADGTALTLPVPWFWDRKLWRAAVLPPALLAAHPGGMTVDIEDAAAAPLSVGTPVRGVLPPSWSQLF